MGFDPLSVTAPARVKVLLLPLGPIASSHFSIFVDRLSKENVVRLGDVSPDGRPHRSITPLASELTIKKSLIDLLSSNVLTLGFPSRLCTL